MIRKLTQRMRSAASAGQMVIRWRRLAEHVPVRDASKPASPVSIADAVAELSKPAGTEQAETNAVIIDALQLGWIYAVRDEEGTLRFDVTGAFTKLLGNLIKDE